MIIVLATRNLAQQVPLLVVQVLQLQEERVDCFPRVGGLRFGRAGCVGCATGLEAQFGEVRLEVFLMGSDLVLEGGCWGVRGVGGEEGEEGEGLLEGCVGGCEGGG